FLGSIRLNACSEWLTKERENRVAIQANNASSWKIFTPLHVRKCLMKSISWKLSVKHYWPAKARCSSPLFLTQNS
ncbi:MAG: hypothetical protein KAT62_04180, partial [Desulfuromonadales bacterium]|nr:hypothetical protein [Desulfuromonadales bacterium]